MPSVIPDLDSSSSDGTDTPADRERIQNAADDETEEEVTNKDEENLTEDEEEEEEEEDESDVEQEWVAPSAGICLYLWRWRPIAWLLIENLGVLSRQFDHMKFALIVLVPSFWSHCQTIEPNFSVTVKNYPRSSDQVWHVRLPLITSDYYFPWQKFSHWPDFPPDLPILWSVGQWDTG